jgi:hypothetical protein
MDPIIKAKLNSLKCPVCQGQVDVLDWRGPEGQPKFNYCCVSAWGHYRLLMNDYIVQYETVVIYEGKHRYEIRQNLGDIPTFSGQTTIYICDVDAENRAISPKKKMFSTNKYLFDFSQTNREKMVNRIKTILVFQ